MLFDVLWFVCVSCGVLVVCVWVCVVCSHTECCCGVDMLVVVVVL